MKWNKSPGIDHIPVEFYTQQHFCFVWQKELNNCYQNIRTCLKKNHRHKHLPVNNCFTLSQHILEEKVVVQHWPTFAHFALWPDRSGRGAWGLSEYVLSVPVTFSYTCIPGFTECYLCGVRKCWKYELELHVYYYCM